MPNFKFPNFLRAAWEEDQQKDGYQFVPCILNLFNFAFFILVSPFRLVKQNNADNVYMPKSYLIHKIVVGIIHVAALTEFTLYIKSDFDPSHMKTNPTRMFDYFRNVCIWLYCVLLMIVLWRGQRMVITVLALTPPNSGVSQMDPKKRLRTNPWKLRAMLLGYILLEVLYECRESPEYWDELPDSRRFRSLSLTKADGSLTDVGSAWRILIMVISAFTAMIINVAHCLVIISAFAVKDIVDYTKRVVLRDNQIMNNVHQLLRMREQIQIVNNLSGTILVAMFLKIVGHTASLIGKSGGDDNWRRMLLDSLRQLVNFVCLFYAAESEYQARMLTSSVIFNASATQASRKSRAWNDSVPDTKTLEIMLRSAPGANGLAGWKFFDISYSFLGAAVSVTLTYALVMLQLVATPPISDVPVGQKQYE